MKKKNNNHNCNVGETHLSSLGEKETSQEKRGGGINPKPNTKARRERDGKVAAGGQQPALAAINPTLLEIG